jgi:glucokinase
MSGLEATTLLVGDVGGTNARFAIARLVEADPRSNIIASRRTPSHLPQGVAAYPTAAQSSRLEASSLYGPVIDGEIDLTNSPGRCRDRAPDPRAQSGPADQ